VIGVLYGLAFVTGLRGRSAPLAWLVLWGRLDSPKATQRDRWTQPHKIRNMTLPDGRLRTLELTGEQAGRSMYSTEPLSAPFGSPGSMACRRDQAGHAHERNVAERVGLRRNLAELVVCRRGVRRWL